MKLKLLNALANVDRSQPSQYVDSSELGAALSIDFYCGIPVAYEERVKSYWLIKWRCTDTWVGLQALFFDDELMGRIWQDARKSPVSIAFVSNESAHRLRDYMLTASPDNQYSLINPTDELDDTYGVEYGSQLLVDSGLYQGQPVTVVRESIVRGHRGHVDEWSNIRVRTANGEEIKISLDDFDIPLHMIPQK